MNLFHLFVFLLVIVLAVLLVRAWIAYSVTRLPEQPEPKVPRRNSKSVVKGYRAHAADIWRLPPDAVSDEMVNAAKRDLYAASYGATLERRRYWLELNPQLPMIPHDSILAEPKEPAGLRAPVRGRQVGVPLPPSRSLDRSELPPANPALDPFSPLNPASMFYADATPAPVAAWSGSGGESGGGGASASWDSGSSSCDTSSSSSDSGSCSSSSD